MIEVSEVEFKKNSVCIGDIGNCYGGLECAEVNGKFYWSIESWDGNYIEEIPQYLHVALMSYQEELEKQKVK